MVRTIIKSVAMFGAVIPALSYASDEVPVRVVSLSVGEQTKPVSLAVDKIRRPLVPDGIYDLVIGGESAGIAVVDDGKFTRPVKAGACPLVVAEGEVVGSKLKINIPDKCLDRSTLDFRGNKGALLFRDSNSIYLNTSVSSTDGDSPSLSLAGGLFLGQHYIYSDAYLDSLRNTYSRGDSKIERDIPYLYSKFVVGDLTPDVKSSLVSGKRMGGVQFARNWAQDPDKSSTVYYSSSHILKLSSRSTVETYRDGILMDRRELAAGEYDLRNIPSVAYSSRLKIRVIDSYGHLKDIDVDAINPPMLLSKGTFDYSLSVGSSRTGFEGFGDYAGFTGGGFVGYGVTDWLSAFASSVDKAFTSAVSVATPVGLFSGEARLDTIGDWRAAYSYSLYGFSANAEYRVSKADGSLVKRDINTNLSVGLGDFGSLTGRFIKGDRQTYGAQYSVSLPWSVAVFASGDVDKNGPIAFGGGLVKVWTPRISSQISFQRSFDRNSTVTTQFSIALDRAKPASLGLQAVSTTQNHRFTDVQTRVEGRYGVYGAVSNNMQSNGKVSSNVAVAASVACAGGICRVGEPVSGGFAVGDNLLSSGTSGELVSLPPYSNTSVTASTRLATVTKVVAVRPGQGVSLTLADKVNVQALVTYAEKPVALTEVTWTGGKTITGEDGLLWLNQIPKSSEIEVSVAGRKIKIPLKGAPVDGIIDVGVIAL